MVILLLGVFNNDNTKVSFDIDYPNIWLNKQYLGRYFMNGFFQNNNITVKEIMSALNQLQTQLEKILEIFQKLYKMSVFI